MQESPLAPLLTDRFDELPTQMQVAARWLSGHPLEVALLSMREQARRAGVPAATMSRIARRLGFDAAVLGAVLPTASHPGVVGLGWESATDLLQQANLPVYLIGGLSPAQLGIAQAAYAQGVAAIRAYW